MQPSGWTQVAVGTGLALMSWFAPSLSIIRPEWEPTVRLVGVFLGILLVVVPLVVHLSRRSSPASSVPAGRTVAPSISGQTGGTSIVAGRDVSYIPAPPQRDLTAIRVRIATLRGEGVQLYARRVRSDDELREWLETRDAWCASVAPALGEHDQAMRLRFENVGPLMAADIEGSFNPLHNHRRLILARQVEILDKLVSELR